MVENLNYRCFFNLPRQFELQDNKLYLGQWFHQLKDLKHSIKMWHIKNHVTFKHKRCAKNTLVLCCRAKGCQRKLKVSERKNLKFWEIRMIERPHTCTMPTISQNHNKMDSKLGQKYPYNGWRKWATNHSNIHRIHRQEFDYTITYRKAWLAKQWALKKVYDNWEESYNMLSKYLQALQLLVPGTIVRFQPKPTLDELGKPIPNKVIFHRLFYHSRHALMCLHCVNPWRKSMEHNFMNNTKERY